MAEILVKLAADEALSGPLRPVTERRRQGRAAGGWRCSVSPPVSMQRIAAPAGQPWVSTVAAIGVGTKAIMTCSARDFRGDCDNDGK
jgi:hypothetical protein